MARRVADFRSGQPDRAYARSAANQIIGRRAVHKNAAQQGIVRRRAGAGEEGAEPTLEFRYLLMPLRLQG